MLPGGAERLPAAGENLQVGALPQQHVDHRGAGINQVLTVVHQKQQALVSQVLGEGVAEGLARLFLEAKRAGHRLQHESWLCQRRKFEEPRAVGELCERVGGHLQTEPRLTAAARPDERQQAVAQE